jgi:hypothetical protein
VAIHRTVQTATTDTTGHLPRDLSLDANALYMICQEDSPPSITHFGSTSAIADWIDQCVLGDLRTLGEGIVARERALSVEPATAVRLGGGNFLLAAGCCMAIEYLGQVLGEGTNATARSKAYVERFLRPIDQRYRTFFWLLWSSFRNGVVHGSWPRGVCVRGNRQDWLAIGANNVVTGEHLEPASGYAGKSFVVSSPRFLQDLERSFTSGFKAWLLAEPGTEVLARAQPRLLEINPRNDEGVAQFRAAIDLNR